MKLELGNLAEKIKSNQFYYKVHLLNETWICKRKIYETRTRHIYRATPHNES